LTIVVEKNAKFSYLVIFTFEQQRLPRHTYFCITAPTSIELTEEKIVSDELSFNDIVIPEKRQRSPKRARIISIIFNQIRVGRRSHTVLRVCASLRQNFGFLLLHDTHTLI